MNFRDVTKKTSKFLSCCALAFMVSSVSYAQSFDAPTKQRLIQTADGGSELVPAVDFSQFSPQPNGVARKLDYSLLDDLLAQVVVDLGPSIRKIASRPVGELGSRFITGHKSPYRLEGKRFTFSYINDEYVAGLTDYRKDLEAIATDYDITKFPKQEQLAFWLNLHNLAVIEKIALSYPVKRPRDLKVETPYGDVELNDAKFITINGQNLSLRDIRENIVYANWNDVDVIYGFFRGDIGSPSIQEYAFTSDRLDYMLEGNAYEFVNSLRGYRRKNKMGAVSEIYKTDGRFFFPEWQQDVKAHLLTHADEKVSKELHQLTEFSTSTYETVVADLAGGEFSRTRNLNVRSGNPFEDAPGNVSPAIQRLLRERNDKYRILRRRGVITGATSGTVIIDDIETDDSGSSDTP